MSQYFFDNSKYSIMIGFDRPLKYHFLVIWKLGEIDEEEPVWSNLFSMPNGGMTIHNIFKIASEYDLKIPEEVLTKLGQDD